MTYTGKAETPQDIFSFPAPTLPHYQSGRNKQAARRISRRSAHGTVNVFPPASCRRWGSCREHPAEFRSASGRYISLLGCQWWPVQMFCNRSCLLYTSDAADEEDSVDLGGRRIIKKKKKKK